jgi:putative ATP-binding cassette transporter
VLVANNLQARRTVIQSIKDCWYLAKPYWTSEDKWRAIGLVSVVIALNLLSVYMSVLFNKWYNEFYDSIQQFHKAEFYKLLIRFTYYAFIAITISVVSYWVRKILEIRWRTWITKYYIDSWLNKHAYYKTRFIKDSVDNPDQRISEDLNSFLVTVLDLTLGFISNIVTLFSFVFILYTLSGPLVFSLFGHKFTIGGYMVWVALIYSFIATVITFIIGRPLIKLNFLREAVEANFRFGLMRIREYSENIAFYKGEKQESTNLHSKFNNVIANFLAIVYRQMKLDIFNVGYSQLAVIFPMLVSAPRYFAKQIQLGDLMQISSAFGKVQGAMSFFIDGYGSLASLRAIMDRMLGFQNSVEAATSLASSEITNSTNDNMYVRITDLQLMRPDGKPMSKFINLSAKSGDVVLVKGRSGTGKTTLLRSIAGIWPYSSGKIEKRADLTELFIGQRPYLPDATLREALCYPMNAQDVNLTKIHNVLNDVNLAYLANELDVKTDWSKMLSLGEQQRLAFARVLINEPNIVYLDEATSSVDEEMEEQLYRLLTTRLSNSLIVSIGHRSTLNKWHNIIYDFNDEKIA